MESKSVFSRPYLLHLVAVFFAAVLFGSLSGCDSFSTGSSGPGTGTLRLLLTDAPFPYDLATEANVTVERVDIVAVDADTSEAADTSKAATEEITTLTETEQEFNLLELQDGITALLAETELEAGTYAQLRLIVSDASVVLEDRIRFNLKVPSGAQTGIKIPLSDFAVEEDGLTELTLDFDVEESFVVQGNPSTEAGIKGFLFKPVVKPLAL